MLKFRQNKVERIIYYYETGRQEKLNNGNGFI
jgi:hypothetical protein